MGCKCSERGLSIKRAGAAVANGRFREAARELKQSVQSFAQDARSAQTRREMLMRAARLRKR